jgi:hypothetical protein
MVLLSLLAELLCDVSQLLHVDLLHAGNMHNHWLGPSRSGSARYKKTLQVYEGC